jgi:hypothetical protein
MRFDHEPIKLRYFINRQQTVERIVFGKGMETRKAYNDVINKLEKCSCPKTYE